MPAPWLRWIGSFAATAFLLGMEPCQVGASATEAKPVAADHRLLQLSFNEGWRFELGENPGAEAPGFDDRGWKSVDLPHDWSIESLSGSPFHDKDTPEGQSVGYLRGGVGWYRKHFTVEKGDAGKEVDIVFDGIQQDSDVWLNGSYLGFQPHGYIAFHYALSGHLNPPGLDNVIVVRAQNPESNSRWYAGSGLYRQVYLRSHDPLHVPVWGARVDTVWLVGGRALLQLGLDVQNDRSAPEDMAVELALTDPAGVTSLHSLGTLHVAPGQRERLNQSLQVPSATTWSPEAPALYQAEFRLIQKDRVVDVYRQTFGIRTLSVSSEAGLLINGKPVKLRGGCLHQDNGLLGSAAFPDAEYRRVELMKRNGFNAIRTSHNPPSSAFLDACDRLGVLVVDEFADTWELPKKPNGYQRYFDAHWERDLGSMLARDFNHPSVIIWSIGNEIPERANGVGLEIGRRLAAFVHRSDARRPVTNAICGFYDIPGMEGQWDPTAPAFALLDVGGYNYFWANYASDHAKYPGRVMMGTESFPRAALENWAAVEQSSYVLGDFVWTGMDYIGESGIGHTGYEGPSDDPKASIPEWSQMPWPWWVSWCGDLDITGVKKPQSFYRDVVWGRSQVELAVHEPAPAGKAEKVGLWGWPSEVLSWNWPGEEGRELSVNIYSRAERVRLELNGRILGEKTMEGGKSITAAFAVRYEPGVLKASAIVGGRVVATRELATTGPAIAPRVTPERATVAASRGSLIYVPIELVDAKGAWVPEAAPTLTVSVEGPAQLQALGTGSPTDLNPVDGASATAFRGRALAILRSTGKPGTVRITVRGAGLEQGSAEVELSGGD